MTRGRGLMLAAATTAFVSACGSSSSSEPPAGPELPPLGPAATAAPVQSPPATDSDRLYRQLLTGADLPRDFTALPPRADVPTGAPTTPTDPADCAKVLTPLGEQHPGALAQAAIQYAGPNFSSIDIDAASYRNDAVAPAFAQMQAALRQCVHYSGADATDIPIDYRVGGLTPPRAGDAATAFQVRTSSEGLTLHSAVAIVQVGATLAQIAVTAPEAVDERVLSELTAAQVRKLQGVPGP
ncbi:hypothetical protein [Nocardia brasiliensis]|uniref:hypothetical protein n=1 Tax=Nocardia brasiliensis TaxID=37326 RepID=UPI0024541455|nr:hypothetical protein [Nocardia brasiliensis]